MQAAVKTMNWRRVAIVCAVLIVCGLAFWLLTRIPKTATIFIIAAFLASAVHPIVRGLESRIPRAWAIALVFTVLIVLAAVCVIVVLPLTIAQSQLLAQNLPQYLQTGQDWSAALHHTLAAHLPGVALPAHFFNLQQFSADRVTAIAAAALASIGTVALNIATAAFIAISALILSVFMLLNHRQMAEAFASFFPTRRRETALRLATQAAHVFGSYIVGQVVVSAITGVLIAALTAAFGFKFALLLGLVSAFAYAVPIVGMLAAHVLGFVIAVPFGWLMVVKVEIVMFVIARISDNILVPKIMGNSVGVSPIGVMFAVFAGGELFGLPGLVLGIPAAALIKLVWGYFVGPWLHAQVEFADLGPTPMPTDMPEMPGIVLEP